MLLQSFGDHGVRIADTCLLYVMLALGMNIVAMVVSSRCHGGSMGCGLHRNMGCHGCSHLEGPLRHESPRRSKIESLIKAWGGTVEEREGSRVRIDLLGEQWRCHRPHPGKDAQKYQVEEARELFERVGVRP